MKRKKHGSVEREGGREGAVKLEGFKVRRGGNGERERECVREGVCWVCV